MARINRILNHLFAFSVFAAVIVSCKHDPEIITITDPTPTDTTGKDTTTTSAYHCSTDTVYFEQLILPMLKSSCAMSGCHDASSHKEGIKLDTYSNIMATGGINTSSPTSSKIYRAMVNGGEDIMPPYPAAPMNSDQLASLSKWIRQGAKDNSCLESGCDTANVAYSTHIRPIITNFCLGCHNGTSPGGGIPLALYSDVKAIADNGRLVGTIDHLTGYSPMPKNGNKLTDCQVRMVKIWIGQGAPNN
ncbi:MAG: hypothetical protein HXX13_00200 [Bacteroidetes bacterium]|nr:hypothetical protein [Bacteroidota bacterium]